MNATARWPVEWSARWIWTRRPSDLPPGDHVGFLRRDLELDTVPGEVPSRVTADSRFVSA